MNRCLATSSKNPGHGLFAFYGASTKALRAGGVPSSLKSPDEPRDYARATAKYPQSTEPASFLITRLLEVNGNDICPAAHYSPTSRTPP